MTIGEDMQAFAGQRVFKQKRQHKVQYLQYTATAKPKAFLTLFQAGYRIGYFRPLLV